MEASYHIGGTCARGPGPVKKIPIFRAFGGERRDFRGVRGAGGAFRRGPSACPAGTQTPENGGCRKICEKELTNLGPRVYSWKKRGSLCGRLRGSSQTSTLEPDAGNAAVGSQEMIFFGGTIRCLRFLLCRCTNAQADGREDVSAVPRRARRAGGSALGPMRAMGSRVPA